MTPLNGPSPYREPYLVLIVDDEAPIADDLGAFVEELGYIAMVAYHGKAALSLVQQRWPKLVITDIMMPQMSGIHLIDELRAYAQRHNLPTPPIIVMSAGGQHIIDEAKRDYFMGKPFDLDEVENILIQFLGVSPMT